MAETPPTNDILREAADEQVKKWLVSSELEQHMANAWDKSCWPDRVLPFISISREVGAGGGEVARAVGEMLGWDVLDKELLDFMADRYQMPRDMLDLVDETRSNWIHDIFGDWFDSQVVSHEKYLVYLERMLWLAGMYGQVVIVGRGAQFVLPRDRGLRVRIVAPKAFRVARVKQERGLTDEEALRWTTETDAGRHQWAHHYFHHDIDEPQLYDVILNSHRIGLEAAPELIVQAYRSIEKK